MPGYKTMDQIMRMWNGLKMQALRLADRAKSQNVTRSDQEICQLNYYRIAIIQLFTDLDLTCTDSRFHDILDSPDYRQWLNE